MSGKEVQILTLADAGFSRQEIYKKAECSPQYVSWVLGGKKRQPRPKPEKIVLRVSEAAQRLGMHPNTLRRLKLIRCFKIGLRGERRYLLSDINAYIEASRKQVAEEGRN